MSRLGLREALRIYAEKAPVDREGPQRSARRARQLFWGQLTPAERAALASALSHAVGGGVHGRAEFDARFAPIRARLEAAVERAGRRAPR